MPERVTPRSLIRETARRFDQAGIPDPLVDAAALLGWLTGRAPLSLRLDSDTVLPQEVLVRYEALCRRRLQREPLQQLIGSQPFCGRSFLVTPEVLIPRPETALLAELAIARLCETPGEALDLCCGSGCLAVTLALDSDATSVSACDLSAGALAVARENARLLGAEVSFFQGDLLSWAAGRSFRVIVSNPPYIPTAVCDTLQPEVLWEPRMALDGGADGIDFYRRIAEDAGEHLLPGGWLLLETGADQTEAVCGLLRRQGFERLSVYPDEAGLPRAVEAQWRTHVGAVSADHGAL